MKHIIFSLFLLFCAAPVAAQSWEDRLIQEIEAEGYSLVERERSLLGRVILEFESDTHERELILNPRNQTVLRDFSERLHEGEEQNFFERLFSPLRHDEDDEHGDD